MTTLDDTLSEISSSVTAVVTALSPVVEMAFPAASAAVSIGQKIIQGVLSAEPMAIALYKQIIGGTPATPEQLSEFAASYEAAYQQLNADINAKLATAS